MPYMLIIVEDLTYPQPNVGYVITSLHSFLLNLVNCFAITALHFNCTLPDVTTFYVSIYNTAFIANTLIERSATPSTKPLFKLLILTLVTANNHASAIDPN